jgi:replicative DNA helicase
MKPQQSCEATRWPADLLEERAALGACLLGQAAEATRLLEADDFSLAANRETFSAICALVERGEAALEIGLLAAELRARGVLDAVGGVPYIEDLDRGVVPERKMESRMKVLRGLADRRRLLKTAEEIERRALDSTTPTAETLGWLREVAR